MIFSRFRNNSKNNFENKILHVFKLTQRQVIMNWLQNRRPDTEHPLHYIIPESFHNHLFPESNKKAKNFI